MKAQLEELLHKEMTRKEFLQHIAAAVLIVFGISGLINALLGSKKPKDSFGYGSSAYGGMRKS